MTTTKLSLQDYLNLYQCLPPTQEQLKSFERHLQSYIESIESAKAKNLRGEREEHYKFILQDFLKDTFAYKCNTKERIDFAIYEDEEIKVLFECKEPDSKGFVSSTRANTSNAPSPHTPSLFESFSQENAQEIPSHSPNNPQSSPQNSLSSKAFYQSILYYLREFHTHKNNNLTHIILTNFESFYLIDAKAYLPFTQNAKIKRIFDNCENKEGNNTSTEKFYEDIAQILPTLECNIRYTSFSLEGTLLACHSKPSVEGEESQLPLLYQALSPAVLLKHKSYIDANTLNQSFYNELLYILGLEEITQSGKVLIKPSTTKNTLLDTLCEKFSFDKHNDFESAFSLLITWNNRLLFLRLLESMLLSFKHIKKPFLSLDSLPSFSTLDTLFFEVLAKREEDRDSIPPAFADIPYLNSSLFDKTELETQGKEIKLLDSKPLNVYKDSILYKDPNLKTQYLKNTATLSLLEYLFAFLHAYDFTTTQADIKERIKTNHDKLINAAVLGLVFEKLNGYKEGSFYTPSFITSYMCKESLEKVILEKFNTAKNWECKDLEELKIRLDKFTTNKESYKEANAIFDSIKLCDPSVGSGHFLVSALNTMILLKFQLGILVDETYTLLKDIDLRLQNDEVIITDQGGKLFAYTLPAHENIESHKIQKALFHTKRKLIESCLFGVDINPNSCEITKLRLWIELLKYSYYKDIKNKCLETLPNIDINIKCGNSLVSRFNLKDSLKHIPNINHQIETYKKLVFDYKNADQATIQIPKAEIEKQIETIKQTFSLTLKDPKTTKELKKALEEHIKAYGIALLNDTDLLDSLKFLNISGISGNLFETQITLTQEQETKAFESYGRIQALRKKLDLTLSGEAYKNAFEWRFAFPEVLDSNGDFLGFDLIIGNPPYMQVLKGIYNKTFYPYSEGKDTGKQNLYKVFIELGYNLSHKNSIISFITQSSIMCDKSAQYTRELLLKNTQMHYFVEFKKNQKIFTNVVQGVCIVEFKKANPSKTHKFNIAINNAESQMDKIAFESITQKEILEFFPLYEIPLIKKGEMPIVAKVKTNKILLKDLLDFSLQGNINTIHLSKIQSPNPTDILIYKGAHCHRYYLDKEPFYGINNELTSKIIAKNQNQYIITTQNITGTADKIRIYANFVESKNTKIVFLHSCNISYCKNVKDAKFLVGILNSCLLNWLFKITSTNNHVNLYELESLPIPKITESNQNIVDSIIALVDEILEQKAKDSTFDTSELESQIDSLVYRLYNLTNEEIKIVENKG